MSATPAPISTALQAFFEIPTAQLTKVETKFRPQKLNKGEYWFHEGDHVHKIAFQVSGFLRVFANTNRNDVTQWVSMPNYFVTDIASFFNGMPARWTVQALTDVELMVIQAHEFEKLAHEIPGWPVLERKFLVKCFAMMENRIFSMLHHTAEERYQLLFSQFPELFNQVPLQYLASMMGMSPETLSRLRSKR